MTNEGHSRSHNREMYRKSRDRVDNALEIFGMAQPNRLFVLPPDDDLHTIIDMIRIVLEDHQTEEETEYRDTILGVSRWLLAALHPEFLNHELTQGLPEVPYVVRKGLELLHLLMHRDLRRRQFSPTEASLVQEFVALANQYPDPEAFSVENEMTKTGS